MFLFFEHRGHDAPDTQGWLLRAFHEIKWKCGISTWPKFAQKVVPYTCGLLFYLVCENLASASSLARTQGWLFCDSSSWHGVLGKGERGQMLYPSKISREIKSLYNYFFDLCWCFFPLKNRGDNSNSPQMCWDDDDVIGQHGSAHRKTQQSKKSL